MKRILIFGASGLVGKAITKECTGIFDVYGTYYSSETNLAPDKQFRLLPMKKSKEINMVYLS